MLRSMLIAMLVVQQALAAWLLPMSTTEQPAQSQAERCCCCEEACLPRSECDSTPRRCTPSSVQRPINTEATPRVEVRTATQTDARPTPDLTSTHARHQGVGAERFARSDLPRTPDAKTRRALLCVRTT
ncbi:MAG: hypothetical protein SFY96_00545 [Planctomycetota bacterium]|nr:hypothetical protein [Planctomycetota bacterium]